MKRWLTTIAICALTAACGDKTGGTGAPRGDTATGGDVDVTGGGDELTGGDDAPCIENDTRPCGTDEGECVAGVETCTDGAWGACAGETPPATEICDDLDNNCDGATDEGCDDDSDGWCDVSMTVAATQTVCPNSSAGSGDDCDDDDANEYPGQVWYADCDDDGVHAGTAITECEQPSGAAAGCGDSMNPDGGWSHTDPGAGADCNDDDAAAAADEDWYPDCDGDGEPDSTATNACGTKGADAAFDCTDGGDPDGGWSTTAGTDCDDEDATGSAPADWYPDCDGDGVAASSAGTATAVCGTTGADAVFDCTDGADPDGGWFAAAGTDCNDEDDTASTLEDWYPDCDGDGESAATATSACGTAGADAAFDCVDSGDPDGGWSATAGTDCNDEDAAVTAATDWYPDCDSDGEPDSTAVSGCGTAGADAAFDCVDSGDPDGGWSATAGTDCNDEDAGVAALSNWYPDCDADGAYDSSAVNACGTAGADASFDCNDGGDPDGGWSASAGTDCNDEDATGSSPTDWYPDCDGDAEHASSAVNACGTTGADAAFDCNDGGDPDGGWDASAGSDCNDEDPSGTAAVDWYPDCDADGEHDSTATNACGITGANAAFDCGDGGVPDGGWSVVAGTDCNDEDAAASALEDWYPDCDADMLFADTPVLACGKAGASAAFACSDGGDPDGGWSLAVGADCNDEDAAVTGPTDWYPDCDADGAFDSTAVSACDTTDADATFDCADAADPDGGWSDTAGKDCNDEDGTATILEDWYPDCDGDAEPDSTPTNACGSAGADAAFNCADGDDPDGGWSLTAGTDCNDEDDTGTVPTEWYPDCDADGEPDASPTKACGITGADAAFDCGDGGDPDGGWSSTPGTDCNDEDGTASVLADWYPDCDGDAEPSSKATNACGTAGADAAFDCADGGDPDGGWHASAGSDCDDEDGTGVAPADWYPDCDGDGEPDATATNACGTTGADAAFDCVDSGDPDGGWYASPGTDCNDEDDAAVVDEDWYPDCDNDAVFAASSITACGTAGADAAFDCADGQNPDGGWSTIAGSDCNDEDNSGSAPVDWYPDCDDDGVHDSTGINACGITGANAAFDCANGDDPPGWSVVAGTDCNDEDGAVSALANWYPDCDDDGFYDTTPTNACGILGANAAFDCADGLDPDGGWSSTMGDDCDDEASWVRPGGIEWPGNDVDENCDGKYACYRDVDEDGYGTRAVVEFAVPPSVDGCDDVALAEAASQNRDCDDASDLTHPGAAELESTWACMLDADDDGYGSDAPPPGVTAGADCDDDNGTVFPGSGCAVTATINSPSDDPSDLLHREAVSISATFTPGDPTRMWARTWSVTGASAGCSPGELSLTNQFDSDNGTWIRAQLADPMVGYDCTYTVEVDIGGGLATDTIDIHITNRAPIITNVANATFDGSVWHLNAVGGTRPTVTVTAQDPDGAGDGAPMTFTWDPSLESLFGCIPGSACETTDATVPFRAAQTWDSAAADGIYTLTVYVMDAFGTEVGTATIVVEVDSCVWVVSGGSGTGTAPWPLAQAEGSVVAALATAATDGKAVCVVGNATFTEDIVLPISPSEPDLLGGYAPVTGAVDWSYRPTLELTGVNGMTFGAGYAGRVEHFRVIQSAGSTVVNVQDASPRLLDLIVHLPPGADSVGIRLAATSGSSSPSIEQGSILALSTTADAFANATGLLATQSGGALTASVTNLSELRIGSCTGTCVGVSTMGGATLDVVGLETLEVVSSDVARGLNVTTASSLTVLDSGTLRAQSTGGPARAVSANDSDLVFADNGTTEAQGVTAVAVFVGNGTTLTMERNALTRGISRGGQAYAVALVNSTALVQLNGRITATGDDATGIGILGATSPEILNNDWIAGSASVGDGIGIDVIGGFSLGPTSATIRGNTTIGGNGTAGAVAGTAEVGVGIRLSETSGVTIADNARINAFFSSGTLLGAGIADGTVLSDGTFAPGNSIDLRIENNGSIGGGMSWWANTWDGCDEGTAVGVGVLLVGTDAPTIFGNGEAGSFFDAINGGSSTIYWTTAGGRQLPPIVAGLWLVDTTGAVVSDNEIRAGALAENTTPGLCVDPPEMPANRGVLDGIPAAPALPAGRAPSIGSSYQRNTVNCALLPENPSGAGGSIPTWCIAAELNAPVPGGAPFIANNIFAATNGNYMIALRQRGGGGTTVVNNTLDADLTPSQFSVPPPSGLELYKWPVVLEEIDADGIALVNNLIYAHEDAIHNPAVDDPMPLVEAVSPGSPPASNIGLLQTNLLYRADDPDVTDTTGPVYVRIVDATGFPSGATLGTFVPNQLDAIPGVSAGTGNFAALPGLVEYTWDVDKSLMRLMDTSDARDAGTTVVPPRDDIDGDVRGDGSYDIGSDEVVP